MPENGASFEASQWKRKWTSRPPVIHAPFFLSNARQIDYADLHVNRIRKWKWDDCCGRLQAFIVFIVIFFVCAKRGRAHAITKLYLSNYELYTWMGREANGQLVKRRRWAHEHALKLNNETKMRCTNSPLTEPDSNKLQIGIWIMFSADGPKPLSRSGPPKNHVKSFFSHYSGFFCAAAECPNALSVRMQYNIQLGILCR